MLLTAAVLVLSGLTGCGSQEEATSVPTQEDPASPTPRPSLSDLGTGAPGTQKQRRLEVTGVVTEGVEQGCLLLSTPTGEFLLMGGDPGVPETGRTVTVVGTTQPELVSTCQQGVPLRVSEVRPAS